MEWEETSRHVWRAQKRDCYVAVVYFYQQLKRDGGTSPTYGGTVLLHTTQGVATVSASDFRSSGAAQEWAEAWCMSRAPVERHFGLGTGL